ncbi:MAG: ribonuclease HII [Candidatus Competibacteraceae bacterium]
MKAIAGVDEAGRGPLAGPVVAAAVILHPARPIEGLADSKQLSAKRRNQLAEWIEQAAWCWALGEATVDEIDTHNILQASLLAMQRAVLGLTRIPDQALIDGLHLPTMLPCPASAVVKGDRTVACISAASILAKTHRDALMEGLDMRFPGYSFSQHKGYGTRQHLEALQALGPSPVHRRSFAPVRAAMHKFR